jgi:hypothetical protein
MNLMLAVEIVVVVLLIGTFGMCLVLNRRLGNLRANQDEMRRLIGEFDKALSRARQGVAELKSTSAAADGAHEERMKQAKTIREELGFMIETADRLADRLAGEAAGNRQAKAEQVATAERAPPARAANVAAAAVAAAAAAGAQFPARRAAASAPAPAAAGNAAGRFTVEPRSEAERELLMALRQAR